MENRQEPPLAPAAAEVSGGFYQILEASARYYDDSEYDSRIPDFRGLTIKQALKLASMKNVKCDIEGSGIVESQRPAAGAIYESDMTILLRCKGDELSHQ